ncbi:CAP domain-containing protein [Streptomyces sp. NBC_01537]|uniref:CAP domain-containing protein n=1 Tax=Streptomyces sp. NBC_01537 TaxID=2903896 RepID=UPI00386B0A9E
MGVPSVAMACMDGPDDSGARSYGHWRSASHTHASADWHQWAEAKAKAAAAAKANAAKAKASPAPTATASPTVKAVASAPASAASSSGATARVVALVNSARSKAGCSALTVNAKLTKAAQSHSNDMSDSQTMSHTGSDGSSPGDRITRAGYDWRTYGENVAYGYPTPESVMAGWMSSPGHKANILNCAFKEIGVGLAQDGYYWTQDFGAAR